VTPPEAPVRTDSFRPVLGATVLLVLALLAIAGLKSSRDLGAARARERMLKAKIAETRAESARLRLRIDRLRHDPGMLERLAREDLGMARAGDVIIELPDRSPAMPSPGEAAPSPHPPAPSPAPSLPTSPGEGGTEKQGVTPKAGSGGPPAPPPGPPPAAAGPPAPE
jgi:cell division protein FtsB